MKSTPMWLLIAFITMSMHSAMTQTTATKQVVEFSYDGNGNRIKREVKTITITKPQQVKKDQQEIQPTEDQMGERTIKIFPNPTRGDLNVNVTNLKDGERLIVTIYDINGRPIVNVPITEGNNAVDMNNQAQGIYILHITNGTERLEYKIIKE
jgi:predicted  nucleic acid-binding Zn-ribbon protein